MMQNNVNTLYKNIGQYKGNIENILMQLFKNLTIKMFKWSNVPEEIPFYAIEKLIFYSGQVVFFSVGGKYFVQSCAVGQDINIYGESVQATPIAPNGTPWNQVQIRPLMKIDDNNNTVTIKEQDAVLIKNNIDSLSSYVIIEPFVKRLAYIFNSIGVVGALSRIKCLLKASPKQKAVIEKELKNLFDSPSPVFVVGDKGIVDQMETIDLGVDSNVDNQWFDFDKTFSYLLMFCGIDSNLGVDKKERLISGEVESSNQIIELFRKTMLEFRQKAVEKINELYGLNISVEFDYENKLEYDNREQTNEEGKC